MIDIPEEKKNIDGYNMNTECMHDYFLTLIKTSTVVLTLGISYSFVEA
jgi:hypothetical protein